MAKTGSITITQGTQEIANNRTYITVKGTITTSGDSYRESSNNGTITVTQDNISIYSGTFAKSAPKKSTTDLFEIGFWVTHKSNGSSGTIVASYNYDGGWCTASTSTTLTDITREFENTINHYRLIPEHSEANTRGWVLTESTSLSGTYNTSVTIPTSAIKDYSGFYHNKDVGSYWGTSSYSFKNVGSTFTQPSQAINIEYFYYPKSIVVFEENFNSRPINMFAKENSTVNGVSVTYDESTGIVTINGTCATSSFIDADKYAYLPINANAGDKYTIAIKMVGGSIKTTGYGCYVALDEALNYTNLSTRNYKDTIVPFTTSEETNTNTLTLTGQGNQLRIALWNNGANTVYNNFQFKVQIEKTDTWSGVFTTGSLFMIPSETFSELPITSRENYDFKGWNTQQDGTGTYVNETSNYVSPLYAIWTPNAYTITFNGNGGTTTVDSLEVAYETTQNNDVSQYIPTRQAYEFLGWYTYPTGGVQVYDANGLCTNDGTYWLNDICVHTEDYTLYAQWKALNIAYGRPNEVWNLYYVYKKANGNWYSSIMYVRPNNEYIR